ncbi:Lipase, class 3 [Artemisia annua]|uniref:Lipase, class 3 n=1 Tax=Artemisia annua TaxID=35608 RepID=A0A2U1PAT3_ARTAN|nr:Lipase, class 3 [Artemisia annua]
MSIICGIPLLGVYCIGCVRWALKRCHYNAGHDSETWSVATPEEFEPVPRLCRYILAVYEDDLRCPLWNRQVDMELNRIVLAIRGLNLVNQKDYAVLLDNKLGQRKFDAGVVLDAECDALKKLLEEYPSYTLTFTGHSLGSGVAALLAMGGGAESA